MGGIITHARVAMELSIQRLLWYLHAVLDPLRDDAPIYVMSDSLTLLPRLLARGTDVRVWKVVGEERFLRYVAHYHVR